MLLIIGNPTNVYLATANGIDFINYFKVMILPTVFAVITAYIVMIILFNKKLSKPIINSNEEVKIKDKIYLVIGLISLFCCTIFLAISSYLNIQMWLIAFLFASFEIILILIISLIRHKKPNELIKTLKRAPWELNPFIISMFIMVLSFEKYQITNSIADLLGNTNVIITYSSISILFANIINNIPMSVLFSSILSNLTNNINQGIYAVIIGSNIGAFLTPIGALAGIMWLQILKDNEVDFNFVKFMKYGVIIVVPTLIAAVIGLIIIL